MKKQFENTKKSPKADSDMTWLLKLSGMNLKTTMISMFKHWFSKERGKFSHKEHLEMSRGIYYCDKIWYGIEWVETIDAKHPIMHRTASYNRIIWLEIIMLRWRFLGNPVLKALMEKIENM